MPTHLEALKSRIRDIENLHCIGNVLEWDMQAYMPPGGAEARSEQMGLVSRLHHEFLTASETGDLIGAAEAEYADSDKDSEDVRLLKVIRREYDRAVKVPAALAEEIARHSGISESVWRVARKENDFAKLAPYLQKSVELAGRAADCMGFESERYDALLSYHEVGAKTSEVAAVFAAIKPRLIALTRQIVECGRQFEELKGHCPIEGQRALTLKLAESLGYDLSRGRQDEVGHPFCTTFAYGDIRITNRFDENYLLGGFYAAMHEAGHALYEQGSKKEYDRTSLFGGASMGMHESQSRLWENMVGRGRGFCKYVAPMIKAAFPAPFIDLTPDRLYQAANRVQPSFIRVEADEVTYNLHVLLRFELERDLFSGNVKVAELPEAWNSKMKEYLGIVPPTDSDGVLQDVHWPGGLYGYFPTYTLGNVNSGQIWHAANGALPGLNEQIAAGKFAPLLEWLRENIYQHGKRFLPGELIERATGEPLTEKYYLDYVEGKYRELYAL